MNLLGCAAEFMAYAGPLGTGHAKRGGKEDILEAPVSGVEEFVKS
jgi:hypothetical protein